MTLRNSKRAKPATTPKASYRIEPDRFNAGEYVVKNERGEVVASSFDKMAEAEEWVADKTVRK